MSRSLKCFIHVAHGGSDTGNITSDNQVVESRETLRFALALEARLISQGHAVMLSRREEIDLSSGLAAQMANDWGADVVFSLHANDYKPNPAAKGLEIWTSVGYTPSDDLATALVRRVFEFLPDREFRRDDEDGDPDKEKDWTIVKKTDAPAVLVELGFMSNDDDRAWLLRPATAVLVAAWLATGLTDWSLARWGSV